MTFEELGLKLEVVKAVTDLGFEHPTPIQEKAIPHILTTKQDLLAFAQTGTGKTAAFGLPVIHQIDETSKTTQVLLLCPTRELCLQISRDLESFLTYLPKIKSTAVYGGARIDKQLKELKRGMQIVVGTPGRTLDLIRRKKLQPQNIQWLILDEADEMLGMGFKDELDAILSETPDDKQTLLFSATKQWGIEKIVKSFMKNPHEIRMSRRNESAANLEHHYYMVHSKNKFKALKRIVDLSSDIYGIIFCRTRKDTQEIADKMSQDGYNADAIHGDLSQAQRDYVMRRFRNKTIQLLVATDVAARGLDIDDLTHVINYHLPDNLETYIHRSGRTGRAGKSGISISIIHSKEKSRIAFLERKLSKKMERKMIPSGEDIYKQQLSNYTEKLEKIEVNAPVIEPYLNAIYERLEELSKEELIQRFLSIELNRLFEYYKGSEDINIYSKDKRRNKRSSMERGERSMERGERSSFPQAPGMSMKRFYINIGKKKQLAPLQLIELINEAVGKKNVEIGKIEILRNFSFFELDEEFEQPLLLGMMGKKYGKVDLVVEPTVTNKPSNVGSESSSEGGWKRKKNKGSGGNKRGGWKSKSGSRRSKGKRRV